MNSEDISRGFSTHDPFVDLWAVWIIREVHDDSDGAGGA